MSHPIEKLRLSADRRHLEYESGDFFLYLADTAWELFHKLSREDAFAYLEDRAEKGFTVIQAALLAERDGLRRSNAYGRSPMKINEEGRFDPLLPDLDGEYSYWDHADAIIRKAAELGLYVALLPAWKDKFIGTRGEGPHMFTPENAFAYGKWLSGRYAKDENIIWVMGGDAAFTARNQLDALDAMARGIRSGEGSRRLMTLHPAAGHSSRESVGGEDWMDFHMIHSGHDRSCFNYRMIEDAYGSYPFMPVLDGEPDHEGRADAGSIAMGALDETDARRSAYWALLSGACGHAYGHHSVANFAVLPDKDTKKGYYLAGWRQALAHPGSGQMKHLRALTEMVPFGEGFPASGMVQGNMDGVNHVPVLKGKGWLIAYSAQGLGFELALDDAWEGAQVCWFNPRTGALSEGKRLSAGRITAFTPPTAGRSQDWALLIRR